MSDELSKRDPKGVRKQVYQRHKEGVDYLPIQADETTAMIDIMKKPFLCTDIRERRKYKELDEFKEVIVQYLDYISDSNTEGAKLIPDIEGFCTYAGICRDTLNDWERTRPGEFSETIKAFKNAVASFKKQLALKGKIPPIVFATDFNNNHGYTQKQELSIAPINPQTPAMSQEEIRQLLAQNSPTIDSTGEAE